MLGINQLNEKLPILIIGKSKNPRCLKGVDMLKCFNVFYYANGSAWMTREIFQDYIYRLNDSLIESNRKILIVMDNFIGFYITPPSNIEYFFLPPNLTSILQPLDQGIINAFKNHYKRRLNNYFNYRMIVEKDSDEVHFFAKPK